MDEVDASLWSQISNFPLDDTSAALTFTARLARENGWRAGFARRVVHEYRRFVYLAMVAGHEVTPSEPVDEVWHLHLTYSRSYWNDLCDKVLHRPLHHHPTLGGPNEHARHCDQYRQTLASYLAHFGEQAPADIWPSVAICFGPDSNFERVNRARNWIISKPRLWRTRPRPMRWLLVTSVLPVVMGIANPFNMSGPEFLTFYGILTVIVVVVAFALRMMLRRDEFEVTQQQLEPAEVACLGRGVAGAMQSCLAALVGDNRIEVIEEPGTKFGPFTLGKATYKLRATVLPASAASEIERAMLSAASNPDGCDAAEILKAAKPIAETVESHLQSRGLFETNDSFGPARWWPVILLAGLGCVGAVKLLVGLSRGKPIGYLGIWLIGLGFVTYYFARRPLRTVRGDRLLNELKQTHEQLKSVPFSDAGRFSPADVMIAAGLFGLAAVEHPQVRLLQSALTPIPTGDGGLAGSSGGCSGGDGGGGGCGGGCGGCGGD